MDDLFSVLFVVLGLTVYGCAAWIINVARARAALPPSSQDPGGAALLTAVVGVVLVFLFEYPIFGWLAMFVLASYGLRAAGRELAAKSPAGNWPRVTGFAVTLLPDLASVGWHISVGVGMVALFQVLLSTSLFPFDPNNVSEVEHALSDTREYLEVVVGRTALFIVLLVQIALFVVFSRTLYLKTYLNARRKLNALQEVLIAMTAFTFFSPGVIAGAEQNWVARLRQETDTKEKSVKRNEDKIVAAAFIQTHIQHMQPGEKEDFRKMVQAVKEQGVEQSKIIEDATERIAETVRLDENRKEGAESDSPAVRESQPSSEMTEMRLRDAEQRYAQAGREERETSALAEGAEEAVNAGLAALVDRNVSGLGGPFADAFVGALGSKLLSSVLESGFDFKPFEKEARDVNSASDMLARNGFGKAEWKWQKGRRPAIGVFEVNPMVTGKPPFNALSTWRGTANSNDAAEGDGIPDEFDINVRRVIEEYKRSGNEIPLPEAMPTVEAGPPVRGLRGK